MLRQNTKHHFLNWKTNFNVFVVATAEPGDEEAVTRAKYFIRDEFLVSINGRMDC